MHLPSVQHISGVTEHISAAAAISGVGRTKYQRRNQSAANLTITTSVAEDSVGGVAEGCALGIMQEAPSSCSSGGGSPTGGSSSNGGGNGDSQADYPELCWLIEPLVVEAHRNFPGELGEWCDGRTWWWWERKSEWCTSLVEHARYKKTGCRIADRVCVIETSSGVYCYLIFTPDFVLRSKSRCRWRCCLSSACTFWSIIWYPDIGLGLPRWPLHRVTSRNAMHTKKMSRQKVFLFVRVCVIIARCLRELFVSSMQSEVCLCVRVVYWKETIGIFAGSWDFNGFMWVFRGSWVNPIGSWGIDWSRIQCCYCMTMQIIRDIMIITNYWKYISTQYHIMWIFKIIYIADKLNCIHILNNEIAKIQKYWWIVQWFVIESDIGSILWLFDE